MSTNYILIHVYCLIVSFPLQCHPCRNSIFELVTQYKSHHTSHTTPQRRGHRKSKPSDAELMSSKIKNERSPLLGQSSNSSVDMSSIHVSDDGADADTRDNNQSDKWKPSELQISALTGVITICAFIISMMVNNLGTVLSVVGATGAVTNHIQFIAMHVACTNLHMLYM